jgi:hypothetical protein
MSLFLGGITITEVRWTGPMSLSVAFTSTHATRLHQLYIGRRKLGETTAPDELSFQIPYRSSRYPEQITVVAITSDEIGLDRGSWLPHRPFNRIRTTFTNFGWSGDPHEIDVQAWEMYTGSLPGGAIDYSSPVARSVADGATSYLLESEPLGPSGTWNVGILGRDTRLPAGNLGTADEGSVIVTSYPPDFETDSPFSVSLDAGTATITATIPED